MLRHLLAKYQEIEVPTKTNAVSQPGGGDFLTENDTIYFVLMLAHRILPSSVQLQFASSVELSLDLIMVITATHPPTPGESSILVI